MHLTHHLMGTGRNLVGVRAPNSLRQAREEFRDKTVLAGRLQCN
jgi:hypothetical protein